MLLTAHSICCIIWHNNPWDEINMMLVSHGWEAMWNFLWTDIFKFIFLSFNNNMKIENSNEVSILRGRDALPSHYLFKIESFSLLSKASIEIYKTSEFDAGDYKWRLLIYPNGDSCKNGENHISIYLELADTNSLPAGWEVNVIFNFLIFNQLQDKYGSPQDGTVRRYHSMRTQWGITKFIDLETFHNPLNGYLVNDTCVFGAEVFVLKSTFKGECLSMIKEPATCYQVWKVNKFSTLPASTYESEPFGDHKWRIVLYSNGSEEVKGNYISIYLCLPETSIPSNTKLFVKVIMRVKDQINGKHVELKGEILFSFGLSLGWRKFISLAKLNDPKDGFLVDDTCIIEAEVTLLGLSITES